MVREMVENVFYQHYGPTKQESKALPTFFLTLEAYNQKRKRMLGQFGNAVGMQIVFIYDEVEQRSRT